MHAALGTVELCHVTENVYIDSLLRFQMFASVLPICEKPYLMQLMSEADFQAQNFKLRDREYK